MPTAIPDATVSVPVRSPIITAILAWLVPGGGHFYLGRRGRGAILAAAVLLTFALGLAMHGPMFQVSSNGDVLSKLIQYGGFVGDVASGLVYFIAVWSGYSAPDIPTHSVDYGSKFLVAAGLLNILAIVDAYEIATREKE